MNKKVAGCAILSSQAILNRLDNIYLSLTLVGSMQSCTFVLLGATGDLSKRKLIPAIYTLLLHKKVDSIAIVGTAITDTNVDTILSESAKFIDTIDEKIWEKLRASFYYHRLDFNTPQGYRDLGTLIKDVEHRHSLSGNRIFYLATMPQQFAGITKNLSLAGVVHKCQTCDSEPWARIVYEKPFGFDLASAREINRAITTLFSEEQIYRIDHYLGKELVGNISLLRFTNRVFEPQWCNKDIDSVQIVISESIGIEGRGKFWESSGSLRDMMQSHMLQLLALVAMEAPDHLSGDYIRSAKAKVLTDVRAHNVVLGQYEGYTLEQDVAADSQVETFAAAHVSIDNDRWRGVPFYLKTGKHLGQKETVIHLKFKPVKCLLAQDCPADTNYLTIQIYPNEGVYLELNAKVPGQAYSIKPMKMELPYHTVMGPNTPAAYETLLIDVIRGDQSVFVREDEIELSWQIIEQLKQMASSVDIYTKGSKGPESLDTLDPDRKIGWRS